MAPSSGVQTTLNIKSALEAAMNENNQQLCDNIKLTSFLETAATQEANTQRKKYFPNHITSVEKHL